MMDCAEGKGPALSLNETSTPGDDGCIRRCIRCGIVETKGESAHGLVVDCKSCSSVGSM